MNVNILIDLLLYTLYLALAFGIGYVMGVWHQADKDDKQLSDIIVQHVQEMEALKKRIKDDGEDWKL